MLWVIGLLFFAVRRVEIIIIADGSSAQCVCDGVDICFTIGKCLSFCDFSPILASECLGEKKILMKLVLSFFAFCDYLAAGS
jgi:hypothetical protein